MSGDPLIALGVPIDNEGNVVTSSHLPDGGDFMSVTHDFANPTTWWQTSERKSSIALTDISGAESEPAGTVWQPAGGDLVMIDMYHGKLYGQRSLRKLQVTVNAWGNATLAAPGSFHGYSVKLRVNSVEKTEDTDFTVDYLTGKITLATPAPGATVDADYSEMKNSQWYLIPVAGRKIVVQKAEIQYPVDLLFEDAIEVAPLGPAKYFVDPALLASNGGPIPDDLALTLTEDQEPTVYENGYDLDDEANGSMPLRQQVGSTTGRGTGADRCTFPFIYRGAKTIVSSKEMTMRIRLLNDTPHGGSGRVTASFYGRSVTE